MRKILLLCLLGLSSTTGFTKFLTHFEITQQITEAKKYQTPEKIKNLLLQASKQSVLLSNQVDSVIKQIKKDPKDVNPFNLSFSLVKDAEKAMKQNQYALAKLYSTVSTLIYEGALGVDEAVLNSDNTETLKAGLGTSVLIYNYSALKQIALEYHIDNQPINFYSKTTDKINNIRDNFNKEYEKFEDIIVNKKHAISFFEDIKKEQNFATLFPQMPSNFEKIKDFDILDYSKKYTISSVYLRNKKYIGADRFFDKKYGNEYKKRQEKKEWETWRNIIKNPPFFIQTPLTEQYSKDKASELCRAIKKIKSSSEIAEKIQNFKTEYPIVLDFSEFDIFETIVENLKEENENEIIKIFNQLLNSKDIIINEKDDPLYYAFLYNKLELAKYLIKNNLNLKIFLSIYDTYEEALFKSISLNFWKNDKSLCYYEAKNYEILKTKYDLLSKNLIQLKIEEGKSLNIPSLLKMIKEEMKSLKILDNYALIAEQTLYLLWFEKLYSVCVENKEVKNKEMDDTLITSALEMGEDIEKKIEVIEHIITTKKGPNKTMWMQFKNIWKEAKNIIDTITTKILNSK